jgi:hypothetical protein
VEIWVFGRTGMKLSVLDFGCGVVGGPMVRGDLLDPDVGALTDWMYASRIRSRAAVLGGRWTECSSLTKADTGLFRLA